MIWTLIAFGITFFVLRKYAFGPIQKTIDDRRDRIRQAVEEADNARNEARELLEQNRAILAQAKSESAEILAEARKVADAQIERAKEEAEVERQRRLEETRKQIEAETARAIDQIRGEVADLTLEATQRVVGKVLDSADQRRLIDEAIEGLDFSVARAGEGLAAMAVAERMYARALYEAALEQGRVERCSAISASSPTRSRRHRSWRRFSPTRRSTRPRSRACSASSRRAPTILVRNFLRLLAERAARHSSRRFAASSRRSSIAPRDESPSRSRPPTSCRTKRQHAILKQIEQASGRTVEATRKVEPELIGGMILQAGSLRVDASVRGRLERLRHELVTR